MSDSNTSSDNGNKTQKRNLPSWMTSDEKGSKSQGKRSTYANQNKENKNSEKTKAKRLDQAHTGSSGPSSSNSNFAKLLEGVVFVLSGFVNPERSTLRAQAIEMGADYRADWNPDCTLLVCAFPNTPKFRQVEADCGTIVSKEWILDCYQQKKLVDIDTYLMHAGKPWRRSNISQKTSQEGSSPRKTRKVEKGSPSKPTSSVSSQHSRSSNPSRDKFSASELKKWAADDLKKTISWLASQEEKPEQNEIKQIAVEGILTCLQDAIDSLEQKEGILQITEQWQCVPRVVEELAKLEGTEKGSASLSKEHLCNQAKACKQIYEEELRKLDNESPAKKKKPKLAEKAENRRNKAISGDVAGYDSEETIEMTEEEIDLAFKGVTSS